MMRLAMALLAYSSVASAVAQETPLGTGALKAWNEAFAVLSHPRCANCHVETDRPAWSGPEFGPAESGMARVHAFNVQRGESGFGQPGLRCATCHAETNAPVRHGPPGAPAWHLAPVEMVWLGKSSAEICAQIKDPARNGDRSLDEIAVHVRDDALVGWGWHPGPGREPAPGSAASTYEALRAWIDGGAPCPPL